MRWTQAWTYTSQCSGVRDLYNNGYDIAWIKFETSDRSSCWHGLASLSASPLNCVDIHQINGDPTTVSTVAAAVTVGTRLPEQVFGVGGEGSIIKNGSTRVTQSVDTVELQSFQIDTATLGQWVCTPKSIQV